MRPGEIFITPIVQEPWINALAKNDFRRIDWERGPRPSSGERTASRVQEELSARLGSQLFRGGLGRCLTRRRPARRVRRHSMGETEYRSEERRVLTSIVKTRCS